MHVCLLYVSLVPQQYFHYRLVLCLCLDRRPSLLSSHFLEIGGNAGEASIITLSAPFIDDVAPKASVSLWFAILSIAPPIGVAVGETFDNIAQHQMRMPASRIFSLIAASDSLTLLKPTKAGHITNGLGMSPIQEISTANRVSVIANIFWIQFPQAPIGTWFCS